MLSEAGKKVRYISDWLLLNPFSNQNKSLESSILSLLFEYNILMLHIYIIGTFKFVSVVGWVKKRKKTSLIHFAVLLLIKCTKPWLLRLSYLLHHDFFVPLHHCCLPVCLPAKHNDITINTFSFCSVGRCQVLLREINLLGLQANGTSKIWLYTTPNPVSRFQGHDLLISCKMYFSSKKEFVDHSL